jgi:CheY-like chemotaxis protein
MSSSFSKHMAQRTILVVAPEMPNTTTVITLLRRFGYPVSAAEDAKQALERAAETRPALIISELFLPDKREGAIFNLFHENIRTSRVPFIFMVPPGDAGAATRCLAYGAGYIMKPVRAEDLYHTVQGTVEPKPRASMRVRMELPVLVNNRPVGIAGGPCEIDLSEEGMRICTFEPAPVRSRLLVQFRLHDRVVSAEGSVVYALTPESGLSGMGLKFINIALQDRDAIRQYIHQEIERPLT